MLKYVDTKIVFQEVPDEITLAINISNCPCNCKNCHSSYLAEDIGEELSCKKLEELLQTNKGITCVSFMGGDANPIEIVGLAKYVKLFYPGLKVAWYSGKQELPKHFNLESFDFIKLGPYIEELGPLTSKTSNQKFYKVENVGYEDGSFGYELNDITYKFHEQKD